MEDYLLIELPTFKPDYKKWEKYGYQKPKEKEKLQTVLNACSGGYCMYCYSRVFVDKKMYGQLEHAVEKSNAKELTDCIPNIGLACPKCNQSFKKMGEKRRKLEKPVISEFQKSVACREGRRKQCTVPCRALRILQKYYSSMEDAKIILQPMGVRGRVTKEMLELQYDIIKGEYQPAFQKHTYSREETEFIQEHILKFHLNDPAYKTHQLHEFVKAVIDNGGRVPGYEYNTLIVEIFAAKLRDKSSVEVLKICESIYLLGFLTAS